MPPPLPWFPRGVFRLPRPAAVSLAPERSHARLEVEAELNGQGNGWTDLTPDLQLDPALEVSYGIPDTGPLALVASAGHMNFTLNNSEANSAMLLGYYTPGHPNCRTGFRIGIRVRFRYLVNGTTYYKFVGWLDEVEPLTGRYGQRKALCVALDWMNELSTANPIIGIQASRRPDEVLSVLQASIARQPVSTNYDVGVSTFPYALDSLDNENGSALSEAQRIAQSEGNGHIFIRGNTTAGGELRMENRTARFAFTPIASFNETMTGLQIRQERNQVRNKVKVTTHPRRVGSVTTDVLFSDQGKPPIPAAATQVLSGDYTDPTAPSERIGGADMMAPVATTDYTANTLASGAGTDLTANFVVTALYGGNSLEHTITNQSSSAGFVTKRQARGRTIKDLDPVDTTVTDQASINLYGETRFFYDMPYQDDQSVAATMANYVLSVWGLPLPSEATVTWRPRTDADKATAMSIEVGSPITLVETMTGINGPFFVNQVNLHCEEADVLEFQWLCQLAVSVPVVQAKATSEVSTDQTSHTVSLPSGIASGDLLISAFMVDDVPSVTWPAGWTAFVTGDAQDSFADPTSHGRASIAYRQADGTEGSTITVTTGAAQQSMHITYRIRGAADPAIQPPQGGMQTGPVIPSADTVVECPLLTPTGGVKNYLWLAVGTVNDAGFPRTLNSVPAGYGNTTFIKPVGGDSWDLMIAERNLRAASEDPGTFSVQGYLAQWIGFTIAIHPKT